MSNIIQDTIRKYNPIKSVQAELLVRDKRIPVSVTRWASGPLVIKPDMDSVFEQEKEPAPEIAQTPETSKPSATSDTQTTLTTDDVDGDVKESTEPTEQAPQVTDTESPTQDNNHNQDEGSPGESD